MRPVYKYWSALMVLAILVQIGLAGYGAFYVADKSDPGPLSKDGFEHGWDPHAGFGYMVVLGGIIFALIALAARLGRPRIWQPVGLLGLLILQVLLAWIGSGVPGLGFLHPINAFLVLGLAGSIAWREWRVASTELPRGATPAA